MCEVTKNQKFSRWYRKRRQKWRETGAEGWNELGEDSDAEREERTKGDALLLSLGDSGDSDISGL